MPLSENTATHAVPAPAQEGKKIDPKAISARIDPDIYLKAKILALKKGIKFNELIEAALEDYVVVNDIH